jgi:AraC-like DNA-binding protein
MDVSAVRSVPIPNRPLSPWLRLAHVHGAVGEYETIGTPLRVLADFELTLQLDGVSRLWSDADGGTVDVPAGSISFIPPGFVHASSYPRGRHISVHFDLHAQPELPAWENWQILGRSVEHRPLNREVPPFALRWEGQESALIIPLVTALPNAGWFRQQLGLLVDIWNRRATASLDSSFQVAGVLGAVLHALALPAAGDRGDPRILALVRRFDEFPTRRIAVTDLADQLGMAETTFREAFARTMGTTPRRYLEERRIEQAARALVETDGRISEIASALGYDDPYHFSRAFKRVTGTPPREYRTRAHARGMGVADAGA